MNVLNNHIGKWIGASHQSYGTMTVVRIQTTDSHETYWSGGAFFGVQCNHIVVASALNIVDFTIMAVTIQMNAVHICCPRVAIIEVKIDV